MTLTQIEHLVRDTGLALDADRCWLYARDPERGVGIALVRWVRSPEVTDVPEDVRHWSPEPADLATIDPLFARALAGHPADTIDDTETGPCNPDLERALGHRAFIHLNLHVDGVLWGTLQPGMTSAPRHWTAAEQQHVLSFRPILAWLVADAVCG